MFCTWLNNRFRLIKFNILRNELFRAKLHAPYSIALTYIDYVDNVASIDIDNAICLEWNQ